jgi:formate dehydrogenase major subunit
MTGKNEGIEQLVGDSYVEISPVLASRLGVISGDRIRLASRRGAIESNARVTDIIDDDIVFMPFHYSEGANILTNTAADPLCKIPELKVCAVAVEKA